MEKSHSGTSTRNDGVNVLHELAQWRSWSGQTRKQKFQAIKVQISTAMVSWLQSFCEKQNIYAQNKEIKNKTEMDGLTVLTEILHNQIINFLSAKRRLMHEGMTHYL